MVGWSGVPTRRTLMFADGTSLLHRANPLTKLAALVWVASLGILLPAFGAAGLALAAAAIGAASGVGRIVTRRLVLTLVPLAIALFVIHGVLIERPDSVGFGPVSVTLAGIEHGFAVLARVGAILGGSLLFVATTHPSDLLKALDGKGVPPAFAYLVASPLLLIEPFSDRARAIRDAQRARGLDIDGSWRVRLGALPAMLVPLVTLALSDMDQRASILTGRAFRALPRRTVLDAPADRPFEPPLRWLLLAATVVQLGLIPWL